MKKSIFLAIISISICASASSRQQLIREQIVLHDPYVLQFNGDSFGMSDSELAKKLLNNGKVDVSTKNQYFKLTNTDGQYLMKWQKQDFENGPDLRLNQVVFERDTKKITTLSTTFNGNYIRTVTLCEGAIINKGLTDKEVFCATASPAVCRNVLKTYRNNQNIKALGKSDSEIQNKVNSCIQTLQAYSNVLKSFAENYNNNMAVTNSREKVIKQEDAEVKNLLSDIAEGSSYKINSINSMKSAEDVGKLSDQLTASMSGLSTINNFISLCQENMSKFNPNQSSDVPSGNSTKIINSGGIRN